MTDWRLTMEADGSPDAIWRQLPAPKMPETAGPERYLPHPALLDAINTALLLGQPLLVTGDPGCGKTELADFLAWRLGLKRALRFETKSDMQARDLLYTFDTVARFHAAQDKEANVDPVRFITYHALGEAIIRATKPGSYAKLLPDDFDHTEKRRSVVLLDEIDKAPRDVPNDLLTELENMRFCIPELENQTVEANKDMRPILVLTSNSEKALPDAFLRRCVYYNIPFPDPDVLKAIVANRIGDLPREADLVSDAISLMVHLREKRSLRKRPGTAELLGFLLALKDLGYGPSDRLQGDKRWRDVANVTLLKSQDDQERVEMHFNDVDWALGRAA